MVALLLPIPFAASTIYVSPDGNDSNSGLTRSKPLASIDRALQIATGLAMKSSVTIKIHSGTYQVTKTLNIDHRLNHLSITSYGTGLPKLIGGIELRSNPYQVGSRFPISARERLRQIEIPNNVPIGQWSPYGFFSSGHKWPVEPFLDGNPLTLARTKWLRTKLVSTEEQISFDPSEVPTPANSDKLLATGYWKFDWADATSPVTQIDFSAGTFSCQTLGNYGAEKGRRFFFANEPEFLDEPGEYFIDAESRLLTYFPTPGLSDAPVQLSQLDAPLFRLSNAEGVSISDIELAAGRSDGVEISGGRANRISNCLVRNFSETGIVVTNSPDTKVEMCDVTGTGSSGIRVQGGDRLTLAPCRSSVKDCKIWRFSRLYRTYRPGIAIEGVGVEVSHNEIFDAPHSAILLGGNDHVIAKNNIYRVCKETGDAGAIYMGRNPTMRGVQIEGNWLHELGQKVKTEGNFTEVMSIYLDDCWCGTTIKGNILEGPGTGIMVGGGRDNIVEGNIFIGKSPAVHVDQRGKGWASKYIFDQSSWGFMGKIKEVNATQAPYATRYPQLKSILEDDPSAAKGNIVRGNVCFGPKWLRLQDHLTENDIAAEKNVWRKDPTGSVTDAAKLLPEGYKRPKTSDSGLLTRKNRPFDRVQIPVKAHNPR